MAVALSQWLHDTRRSEVIEPVKNDPRTVGKMVLGVNADLAMQEVAGWGQAEFDSPYGDLTPADRVLLYAYFFQLGHLEELTEAFGQLFANSCPDEPIVVDLGCGPFTGGLAVAGVLGRDARFDYIGVDQSAEMCRFGEQLATAIAVLEETPAIEHCWFTEISSVSWNRAPGWRPVIVIVSYLLASPTLDATSLTAALEKLLAVLGRGSVTVLYTNSTSNSANRSFPAFRKALEESEFRLIADDTGAITIQRITGTRRRNIRYALFHRGDQNILRVREG